MWLPAAHVKRTILQREILAEIDVRFMRITSVYCVIFGKESNNTTGCVFMCLLSVCVCALLVPTTGTED